MTFSEKLDKKALSYVADRYDAYIVGSDQVWNPLITGGDSAYFLDFVKDRQKKFAYAASFGVSSWPVGYPSAGKLLEDFRAIWQHFVKPATGMFAALSDVVLEMGGVVYSAGYDEEWNVMHKRAETKEARDEMRGSKYVQSDMRDTFCRVLEDLSKGRTVLFSCTHC